MQRKSDLPKDAEEEIIRHAKDLGFDIKKDDKMYEFGKRCYNSGFFGD